MDSNPYKELILRSLKKEREIAYSKLTEIDKTIKAVKNDDYSMFTNGREVEQPLENIFNRADTAAANIPQHEFPLKAETKIQILRIMDIIGEVCKLKLIQDEFKRLTGSSANIRESVRTLNKAGKILMMKENDASRGNYWVKSEWVEDGKLLDKYKFEGFNTYYNDESLKFI